MFDGLRGFMLTLVMIVKDEAETIRETLESARGVIDRWCILDTGSTDGTQAFVQEALAGIPGELCEEPFVDFSTSRNRVMALGAARFPGLQLMLSGTEVLHGGKNLKAQILACGPVFNAYHVMVHFGSSTVYPSLRIADPAAGRRYVGRTHEVLVGPPDRLAPAPLADGFIQHKGKPGGEDKTARWRKDAELLLLDHQERPGDPRPVFYLAQTAECLGERQRAYELYLKRAGMGGYVEERYIAMLRMGRLAKLLGASEEIRRGHFVAAVELVPARAEALYELGQLEHQKQNWAMAYFFAKEAYMRPWRPESLFAEVDIHEWRAADLVATHAFRLGDMSLGLVAARRAVEKGPADARLKANLAWYEEQLK
jgi:hypothetical protein